MDTYTTPDTARGLSVSFYDMQSVLWSNLSTTQSTAQGHGQLPPEMQFTSVNVIVIVIYSNLFWISLLGNITVFSTLVRKRKKTRVHILLINLCTADIIVTVIEMPLKVRHILKLIELRWDLERLDRRPFSQRLRSKFPKSLTPRTLIVNRLQSNLQMI